MEKIEQKVEETMIGTRDLFMETLTKIGCQYSIDEQDDRIGFAFRLTCQYLLGAYMALGGGATPIF